MMMTPSEGQLIFVDSVISAVMNHDPIEALGASDHARQPEALADALTWARQLPPKDRDRLVRIGSEIQEQTVFDFLA